MDTSKTEIKEKEAERTELTEIVIQEPALPKNLTQTVKYACLQVGTNQRICT